MELAKIETDIFQKPESHKIRLIQQKQTQAKSAGGAFPKRVLEQLSYLSMVTTVVSQQRLQETIQELHQSRLELPKLYRNQP